MTEPFHVDPDGLRTLARVQSDVAEALDVSVAAAESELTDFDQRYGPIADPARSPLSRILVARSEALNALSRTSSNLSERLTDAAQSYDRTDDAAAAELRDDEL